MLRKSLSGSKYLDAFAAWEQINLNAVAYVVTDQRGILRFEVMHSGRPDSSARVLLTILDMIEDYAGWIVFSRNVSGVTSSERTVGADKYLDGTYLDPVFLNLPRSGTHELVWMVFLQMPCQFVLTRE